MRNINCQQQFREYTSKNNILSDCFKNNKSVDVQFKKWQSKFQKTLHACFKKVRVKNKENILSPIDKLMKEKSDLIKQKNLSITDKEKVIVLDEKINKACEEKEWEKLVKVLGSLEVAGGGTNNTNVWKEMQKAFPKKTVGIPSGVKNIPGKVITNPTKKYCYIRSFSA